MQNTKDEKYNGWANYETWNVVNQIDNVSSIYIAAVGFMHEYRNVDFYMENPYKMFIEVMELQEIPNGEIFFDNKLNIEELNEFMHEFDSEFIGQ